MRFRLLHHPAPRSLSKKIGLIAAANIGMGTYKPALLNAGERARLGDDRILIFRMANVPECGSEVVAVLIDGKGVIAVQDTMPRKRAIQCAIRSTNRRNFMSWLPAAWRRPTQTDGFMPRDQP